MTPFRLKYLAALVGIVFLSAVFISWSVHFVQSEHTIHSWDHILLWTMGAELASRAHHGVLSLIAGFGWSMHHDYNDLSVLPTAVAMTFGGTSRLCFVLANVIFLIIPSVILCWWLLVGVKLTTWPQTAAGVLSFVALLAVPLPWVVTMNGMTDVAGLIMACIATDLLIRTDIRSRRVETSVKVAGFRPWLRSLRDRFTSDGLSGGVARGLAQPPATSLAKEAFLQRSQVIRWLAIGAAMALTALSKRWFL